MKTENRKENTRKRTFTRTTTEIIRKLSPKIRLLLNLLEQTSTTVGVCARTSDAAWNTSEGWLDFAKNVRAQKKKPKTKLIYR